MPKRGFGPTKVCPDCNIEKSRKDGYYSHKGRRGGIPAYCKECARIRDRKWVKDNPEKRKGQRARYWNKNKEKVKAKQYLFAKTKGRYAYAAKFAKRRGLEFTISKEEHSELMKKPCEYCGKSIENRYGVGLDRLDNSKGYIIDNRGDLFSYEEMKKLAVVIRLIDKEREKNVQEENQKNGLFRSVEEQSHSMEGLF